MSQLEQLAELAESHLQSQNEFYLIIDMMRHVIEDQRLIARSNELKRR